MKKKLGEEHPETLISMSNLAGYYDRLGRSGDAARIGEECWEIMKEKLGEEHPNTLTLMGNLASYYDRLGRSEDAARLRGLPISSIPLLPPSLCVSDEAMAATRQVRRSGRKRAVVDYKEVGRYRRRYL